MNPDADRNPGRSGARRGSAEALDRLLDDAVAVERAQATGDPERALRRLRTRLDAGDRRPRPALVPRRWALAAAAVPVAIGLALAFGIFTPEPGDPAAIDPGDLAVVENLEILELLDGVGLLDELGEDGLDTLDGDALVEFLEQIEILETLEDVDSELLEGLDETG